MRLSETLADEQVFVLQKGEAIPIRLHDAVRSVLQRFPEVDASELDSDIDQLLEQLDDCRKKDDWTGIKWRHAASTARAIFTPPRSRQKKWDRLREVLLETLNGDHKRSFAKASFSAYLEGFEPGSVLTERLAESLGRSLSKTFPNLGPLIEKFSLFKMRGLERRVAEFMVAQDNPYDGLERLGISTPHMSGLFQQAYRLFVNMRRKQIARQDSAAVKQVLLWLHPKDDTTLGVGQAAAINALLEPWKDNAPRADIQERIRSVLIDAYGDPRLSDAEWGRPSKAALTVIQSWLTESSLEQFLDIVSAVEGSHMWQPRRDFWQGIYKKGLIDEAWVILSSQGAKRARDLAKNSDDKSYLSHGNIRDLGSEARCHLILRCGKCIAVEGSHNFSIRFYGRSNNHCPTLYQDSYSSYDFDRDLANVYVPHTSNWQNRANSEILKIRRG